MVQPNALLKVIEALEVLEIPYMVVGSFASNYWGRPRTTHDGDVVVDLSLSKVDDLAQWLSEELYAPDFVIRDAVLHRHHMNAIHLQTAFKVDLWAKQETPYEGVRFQRRMQGTMFGRKVWITSAEDIILSKLLWYKSAPVQERQL